MFKYVIFMMICFTCFASEPKFTYMQCVKIKKGFYKDCKGNTIGVHLDDRAGYEYDVQSPSCKGGSFIETFNENDLMEC